MLTSEDGRKFKITAESSRQAYNALQQKLGGEPQQEVSTAMDVAKSLGSGAVRGAIAIPETVEIAGRGLLRLGQEGLQALGYEKALGMDITEVPKDKVDLI